MQMELGFPVLTPFFLLLPILMSTPLLISSLDDNRPDVACKGFPAPGPSLCSPHSLWPVFVYQHRGRGLGPNKPEPKAKLLRLQVGTVMRQMSHSGSEQHDILGIYQALKLYRYAF